MERSALFRSFSFPFHTLFRSIFYSSSHSSLLFSLISFHSVLHFKSTLHPILLAFQLSFHSVLYFQLFIHSTKHPIPFCQNCNKNDFQEIRLLILLSKNYICHTNNFHLWEFIHNNDNLDYEQILFSKKDVCLAVMC